MPTDSPCINCESNKSCILNGFSNSIEHTELTYQKGELIIKQGSIAPHVVFVKEGMVKFFLEHKDRKQVLCIEKEGFVGLESIYNDKFFQYSVSAVSDVKVCHIEIDSFKKLLESDGSFASKIIESINIRLKNLYKRIFTLTQKQAHARVADLIICFVERIYHSNTFLMPFTRKEFAEMANLSIESLSRILKEFNSDDIVHSKGKNIDVVNMKKLEKISDIG